MLWPHSSGMRPFGIAVWELAPSRAILGCSLSRETVSNGFPASPWLASHPFSSPYSTAAAAPHNRATGSGRDRGLSSVQKARPGPSHPPACTPRLAAWHCHCFWKQRGEGWCRPHLPSQSCLLPTSPGLLFHPTPRMTGRMQAWPPGSGCGLTKTRTKEVNTGPFPTVYII